VSTYCFGSEAMPFGYRKVVAQKVLG